VDVQIAATYVGEDQFLSRKTRPPFINKYYTDVTFFPFLPSYLIITNRFDKAELRIQPEAGR